MLRIIILNLTSNYFSPNNLSSPTATPSQPNHHAYQNKPNPNLVPQNYFNFNNIDQNNNNISYRVTNILLGHTGTPLLIGPDFVTSRTDSSTKNKNDTCIYIDIVINYIVSFFLSGHVLFCDSI